MATRYVFSSNASNFGQFSAPTVTEPSDSGSATDVTVIINSGVPRGQLEKVLMRAIKYASVNYQKAAPPDTGLSFTSFTVANLGIGFGYAVGDEFQLVGGTFTRAARGRVTAESGTSPNAIEVIDGGSYTVLPPGPPPGQNMETTNITGSGLLMLVDGIAS